MKIEDLLFVNPPFISEGEEFWCSICDLTTIISGDKSTGNFYSAKGHILDRKNFSIGEEKEVIFAVCTDCLSSKEELSKQDNLS